MKPDVVFTCGETHKAYLTKGPEIILEIISPSTAKKDENYKFGIYEAEKVNYYFLVYPDNLRAKVYKLKNAEYDKDVDSTLEMYNFENMNRRVEVDSKENF